MVAFQRPKAVYVHICSIRNGCISEAKGCWWQVCQAHRFSQRQEWENMRAGKQRSWRTTNCQVSRLGLNPLSGLTGLVLISSIVLVLSGLTGIICCSRFGQVFCLLFHLALWTFRSMSGVHKHLFLVSVASLTNHNKSHRESKDCWTSANFARWIVSINWTCQRNLAWKPVCWCF